MRKVILETIAKLMMSCCCCTCKIVAIAYKWDLMAYHEWHYFWLHHNVHRLTPRLCVITAFVYPVYQQLSQEPRGLKSRQSLWCSFFLAGRYILCDQHRGVDGMCSWDELSIGMCNRHLIQSLFFSTLKMPNIPFWSFVPVWRTKPPESIQSIVKQHRHLSHQLHLLSSWPPTAPTCISPT